MIAALFASCGAAKLIDPEVALATHEPREEICGSSVEPTDWLPNLFQPVIFCEAENRVAYKIQRSSRMSQVLRESLRNSEFAGFLL